MSTRDTLATTLNCRVARLRPEAERVFRKVIKRELRTSQPSPFNLGRCDISGLLPATPPTSSSQPLATTSAAFTDLAQRTLVPILYSR